MKKSLVIKLLLLNCLLFVSGSLAGQDYYWTGAAGNQYDMAANWDQGSVPDIWWYTVAHINGGGNVLHNSGFHQNLGMWVGDVGAGIGQLTVSSGSTLVGGYNGTASYAEGGWIAIGNSVAGIVNVDGGDLWANNDLHVGTWGGAPATLNITAGNVWAKKLYVGPFGNDAQVNISGGVLNLMHRADAYNTASFLQIAASGNIDISGTGEIHHWGDATAGFAWLANPANGNLLTAFGGQGTIHYEYIPEGDYTKVWATIPEPLTIALFGLGCVMIRKNANRN